MQHMHGWNFVANASYMNDKKKIMIPALSIWLYSIYISIIFFWASHVTTAAPTPLRSGWGWMIQHVVPG